MANKECIKCGSSDGAQEYEDTGLTHCFVCKKTYKLEGDNMSTQTEVKIKNLTEVNEISNKIRNISPKTFKDFSYGKDKDGNHVINMFNDKGLVVAQKVRYPDKKFSWYGDAKSAVPFGLNKCKSGGKRITITEGELDCLSVYEAVGTFPVISISNGAQSAKKDLIPYMEFLNSYKEIVIWFDMDEPGRKALEEVASLFPPGKVSYIDSGTYKDANEVLKNEGTKGVLKHYYDIINYSPAGIVNANEGGTDALWEESASDEYYESKYPGLDFSKGAITTIVSGSGMGKTTITKEVAYDFIMKNDLQIGYVALEESIKQTKRGFIGIHMNRPLISKRKWKYYKENEPNGRKKFDKAFDEILQPGNLHLYDHFGSLDSDILINKLRYYAIGLECDFIILDHISIVVSGLEDAGNDERKTLDLLMTKLRSLVEETGVGMILISHLKRPSGDKGHEDGIQISLAHLRGSGGIGQISDKVIGLEGNQQDEDTSHERIIRCVKDREEGETGILSVASYDRKTGRLEPKIDNNQGLIEYDEFGDETEGDF